LHCASSTRVAVYGKVHRATPSVAAAITLELCARATGVATNEAKKRAAMDARFTAAAYIEPDDVFRARLDYAASMFDRRTIEDLEIVDEPSFRSIALYADLKGVLARAGYPFRVLRAPYEGRSDRALLLNLTFWSADAGGDILAEPAVDADVVTHVAWHHLASRALGDVGEKPSSAALFLGESIASAFDLYLVGRLLRDAPESSFLETQIPAMDDVTAAAGLSEDEFAKLLESVADDPARAFADLRALLFDSVTSLFACDTAEDAITFAHDEHRFASLLHRYELSNWVLYARAHGGPAGDARTTHVLEALASAPDPLVWLTTHWVQA
jgi:hypothetical protein